MEANVVHGRMANTMPGTRYIIIRKQQGLRAGAGIRRYHSPAPMLRIGKYTSVPFI